MINIRSNATTSFIVIYFFKMFRQILHEWTIVDRHHTQNCLSRSENSHIHQKCVSKIPVLTVWCLPSPLLSPHQNGHLFIFLRMVEIDRLKEKKIKNSDWLFSKFDFLGDFFSWMFLILFWFTEFGYITRKVDHRLRNK